MANNGEGDSDFKSTRLFTALTTNDCNLFNEIINENKSSPFTLLNSTGETYLHLAIKNQCDIGIIKGLLPKVRIGQRNIRGQTALDLVLLQEQNARSFTLVRSHQDFILDCIKDGSHSVLRDMVLDGWQYWPVKGIPEIEQFPEAPGYLGQAMTKVRLKDACNIRSKQDLQLMSKLAFHDSTGHLAMEQDLMGMTLLHKAILHRDLDSVETLMVHRLRKEFLQIQDNMGRTPLHYLGCYGLRSAVYLHVVEFLTEIRSVQDLYEIKDHTGHNFMDYMKRKAKIDTVKVLQLCKYLGKLHHLDYFFFSTFHNTNFILRPGVMKDGFVFDHLIKDCMGNAMTDMSGRNLLHQLVLFDQKITDPGLVLQTMLTQDKAHLLLQGQDLWGRTPLHYMVMFNRDWMVEALQHPRFCGQDLLGQLQKVQDNEGKCPDDYRNGGFETKQVSEDLCQTVTLLHLTRTARQAQWKVLLLMTSDEELDPDIEQAIQEEMSVLKKLDGVKMLLSMKDALGNTLLHYAVRFDYEPLLTFIEQEVKDSEWLMTQVDHMGRTVLHYLPQIYKSTRAREMIMKHREKCQGAGVQYLLKDVTGKVPKDSTKDSILPVMQQLEKELHNSLGLQKPSVFIKNPPRESETFERMTTEHARTSADNKMTIYEKTKISTGTTHRGQELPYDSCYLKQVLGECLTDGIARVVLVKPADPVEYLAQFLYKYSESTKYQESQRREGQILQHEHDLAEEEGRRQEVMRQEQEGLMKESGTSYTEPNGMDEQLSELDLEDGDSITDSDYTDLSTSLEDHSEEDKDASMKKTRKKRKERRGLMRCLSGMSMMPSWEYDQPDSD